MTASARTRTRATSIVARRSSVELWVALATASVLGVATVTYNLTATRPSPAGVLEHLMGIGGTLLMLFTEVGYSVRKRLKWFNIGPLSAWLSVHIFTGIVGPAMVLFHTTLRFSGLASLASVLTALVVASGFLGRYLYTAIPRTVAGVELSRDEFDARIARARAAMNALAAEKAVDVSRSDRSERQLARRLAALKRQTRRLDRQLATLDTARRLLGIWHLVHVPMGLTLFGSVFIHIVGVIYYGATAVQ